MLGVRQTDTATLRKDSLPERHDDDVAAAAIDNLEAGLTELLAGENLLLLRYVELRGRIHRILSVLKMRDSTYENDLREFEITDEGIRVLAPLRSVKGLLTGQAHPIGSSVDEEIH